MSHNNKNARNIAKARAMSVLHAKGEKGPASTAPQHGKRWGYRNNPEVMKRIAEALKASKSEANSPKTSGNRILKGAGKASTAQPVA